VVNHELPHKEFVRLTQKMFPKWAKEDTKIARFIQNLDPRKVYTITEIRTYCSESSIKYSQVIKIKTEKSNAFGMIIQKHDDMYRLYPELVKAYESLF
jgi:hypothetical protein